MSVDGGTTTSTTTTSSESVPPVPVGVTSKVGYVASALAALSFVLVLVLHVDDQQAALITTSILTLVSFAVTQLGRYSQARALISVITKRSHTS